MLFVATVWFELFTIYYRNQGDNVNDFMESSSISDIIKDKHEDLAKLTGSVCYFLSFFLFISFISFTSVISLLIFH